MEESFRCIGCDKDSIEWCMAGDKKELIKLCPACYERFVQGQLIAKLRWTCPFCRESLIRCELISMLKAKIRHMNECRKENYPGFESTLRYHEGIEIL